MNWEKIQFSMKTLYLLIFFLPGGDSAEPPHELEDDADPGENQTVHVVRPITIMYDIMCLFTCKIH